VKPACSFCGGPDNARMIRRPFGTCCLLCATYIDRRGAEAASLIPRHLRRSVVDLFTWGALRFELENASHTDDDTDPFVGVS
jgi:hypothetical protein